jgi:hypothetical protein
MSLGVASARVCCRIVAIDHYIFRGAMLALPPIADQSIALQRNDDMGHQPP